MNILRVFLIPSVLIGFNGIECRLEACKRLESPDICYKTDSYSVSIYPSIPTLVNTTIWMKDVSGINEEKQTVTIFIDVVIQWFDERVSFNQTDGSFAR